MKIIFTEGSIHHLATMEMHTAPQIGEEVVVDNKTWTVDSLTHFPKKLGTDENENEDQCGWDKARNADMTVHLVREE